MATFLVPEQVNPSNKRMKAKYMKCIIFLQIVCLFVLVFKDVQYRVSEKLMNEEREMGEMTDSSPETITITKIGTGYREEQKQTEKNEQTDKQTTTQKQTEYPQPTSKQEKNQQEAKQEQTNQEQSNDEKKVEKKEQPPESDVSVYC